MAVNIKIGRIPGEIKDLTVDEGTTIAQAIEQAYPVTEREVSDHHHHGRSRTVREGGRPSGSLYLNGEPVEDESRAVEEGDTITFVPKIDGNL